MKKLVSDLKIILWGYKTIHGIQRHYVTIQLLRAAFNALYPFVNIYCSALVINELTTSRDLDRLLVLIGITIGFNFLTMAIYEVFNHVIGVSYQRYKHKYQMFLGRVVLDAPYEKVEDPAIHMQKQQIIDNHDNNGGGLQRLIGSAIGFFEGAFTLILSIGLSVTAFTSFSEQNHSGILAVVENPYISVVMAVIIVGASLISMRISSKALLKGNQISNDGVAANRLYHFYIDYMENYHTGKDIRLYRQHGMLKQVLDNTLDSRQNVRKRQMKSYRRSDVADVLASELVSAAAYIFIGLKALAGAFQVGFIVQYIGSINRFSMGLSQLVGAVGGMMSNTEQLHLLKDYIALADISLKGAGVKVADSDTDAMVEFRNVSFKYPGTDRYVLNNLSLTLERGKRFAVVGINGSGKTTFIKLLCRLYDPDEGEILLNGRNIKDYDYAEYLKLFGVVFQDFNLFAFPLGENVAVGTGVDEVKARQCLEQVGFGKRMETMGLEAHLYRDFDVSGVEISGGEAQKIAMARALYRDAPLLILDEPTAALDPIAEYEVYAGFDTLVGNKTAVYISHRLSSCRFCDEIFVFEDGSVVQQGSHEALLAQRDSQYHQLWHAQAQYYDKSSST